MHYRLDPSLESFTHALCEAVVLKSRLALVPQAPDAMILRDLIEDLARGIGLRCGLPQDANPGSPSLVTFLWEVHRCSETWHVARAFLKSPPLDGYLMVPYFGGGDLRKLDEWRNSPDGPGVHPQG